MRESVAIVVITTIATYGTTLLLQWIFPLVRVKGWIHKLRKFLCTLWYEISNFLDLFSHCEIIAFKRKKIKISLPRRIWDG